VSGAQAHLLLMNADTEHLKRGDTVAPAPEVGSAVSGFNGRYNLTVTPTAQLRAAAQHNDGWVNFELQVRAPGGTGTQTHLSRRLVGSRWQGRDASSSIASVATLSSGNLAAPAAGTVYYYHCKTVLLSNDSLSSRIIDFHNSSNADSYWTYGSTADSDIDVGVDLSGGGWGISGSTHIGSTYSASVTGRTGSTYNRYARTDFRYPHIEYVASIPSEGGIYGDWCTDGIHKIGTEVIYANAWAGGTGQDTGTTGTSCAPYPQYRHYYGSHSTFRKNNGRETKIVYSVNAAGAHLGGTNGYSSYVSMGWTMTRGGMYICGRYADETSSYAGVIYTNNP